MNYNNYQLQWLMDHNYSLTDFIKSIEDYINDSEDSSRYIDENNQLDLQQAFIDWQFESGFNHDLYVCKDEFNQTKG